MKINVGSKNSVKVGAVEETLKNYSIFDGCEVEGVDTNSGVSEQPKSLDETVRGAVNRAKAAFNGCDYSFGIESGLMPVPNTKTGYMDFCACAIYDGSDVHLGLSCALEFPTKITELIHSEGIDANEACYRAGLSTDRKIGSSQGLVGMLTKGRMDRKAYTKTAIQMALIHLENRELY